MAMHRLLVINLSFDHAALTDRNVCPTGVSSGRSAEVEPCGYFG